MISTNTARPFILDDEKMELLFPFYFAFNERLKLIKEGKSLKKLLPSLRIRRKINAYFSVSEKTSNLNSFSEIEEGVEVVLTIDASKVKLKGTFMQASEGELTYFFGSPLLQEIDELKKLKLDKNDFAGHDTGLDQLYRFHSNHNTLKKLSEQKKQFSQTNLRLSQNMDNLSSLLRQGLHELSEPIRNNIVYTGLIEERATHIIDEDLNHALFLLNMGSLKAKKLLDALRTYLTLQKSLKNLDSTTELELIIISIQSHLEELISKRNATIKFYANSAMKIDFRHIKFILQCLIENAIYFNTSEKPVVEVKCQRIEKYWFYTVEDNGIGIPKGSRNEIFDPFKRLNTKLHQGIGMSLTTCKMLIELYGGKIWVERAKGKGSRFCFTIATDE